MPSLGKSILRKKANEDFSDISDIEVAGYLLDKKAANMKQIIWEAINKDYLQGNKQKQPTIKKKAAPAKKTVGVTTSKVDTENIRKRSSKIDYEAFDKLFGEPEVSKKVKVGSLDFDRDSSFGDHPWEGNYEKELEKETTREGNYKDYSKNETEDEEVGASEEYYDDLYQGNEDEEECDYYNLDIDGDYEEF